MALMEVVWLVDLHFLQVPIAGIHRRGIEMGGAHIGLQRIAPIEKRRFGPRGLIHRADNRLPLEPQVDERELVPLDPVIELFEARLRARAGRARHQAVACLKERTQAGELVLAALRLAMPDRLVASQDEALALMRHLGDRAGLFNAKP